jgi:hypothetical protein
VSDLYTVRLKRKIIIVRYDDKGRRIGERVELVEETYTSLPYPTALGYKRQFPDNEVTIIRQERQESGRRNKVKVGKGHGHTAARKGTKSKRSAADHAADKARRATYADAINEAMRAA